MIASTTSIAAADEPAALFQPFEWVPEQDQIGPYDMLSDVRDLASGTALVLGMIERSYLLEASGGAPLLDGRDAAGLLRMSIATMKVIQGNLDDHFDFMNDNAAKRRKAAAEKEGAV